MLRKRGFAFFIFLCLILSSRLSIVYAEPGPDSQYGIKTGTVTGKLVLKNNVPMNAGTVFFFSEDAGAPPSATKYWRVPGEIFVIDNNGCFSAEIPEGKYYMGALMKKSGEQVGPPQNGDPFFINQDEKGDPKLVIIKNGVVVDMGVMEAIPFDSSTLAKEGVTSIEGAVIDIDDKPVEGVLVFAFPTQTIVGRPLFVSDRTGKDGKYLLRVAGEGTYYFRVRENYGGGPLRDSELKGVYGDKEPPTAIRIKSGETLTGFNIRAFKFEGRGPKSSIPVKE